MDLGPKNTKEFRNPSKKNFRMPYTAVDSPRHPNDFVGSLTGLKERHVTTG